MNDREIFLGKDHKINLIGLIILSGFVASIFYHYIMAVYCHRGYPYTTFLFYPADRFNDFFNNCKASKHLNPYFGENIVPSIYFPFLNILFYLFCIVHPKIAFAFFLIVFVCFTVFFNEYFLKTSDTFHHFANVLIFSFLTYPFLFIIDRGNSEGLLFVFLVLFIYCYYYKEKLFLSILFLSLAIAMKAYPAVFFILLLSNKDIWALILSITMAVALTLLSLLFHKGGFYNNLSYIMSGFGLLSHPLVSGTLVQRGLSIFILTKIILIKTHLWSQLDIIKYLTFYQIFTVVIAGLIGIYVIFIEQDTWKKVFLATLSMLVLPFISVDYKLIHVFLPIYLFIDSEKTSNYDLLYTFMFGLLLIPKDYYFFKGIMTDSGFCDISISVPLNILIMFIMSVLIAKEGLHRHSEINRARTILI